MRCGSGESAIVTGEVHDGDAPDSPRDTYRQIESVVFGFILLPYDVDSRSTPPASRAFRVRGRKSWVEGTASRVSLCRQTSAVAARTRDTATRRGRCAPLCDA